MKKRILFLMLAFVLCGMANAQLNNLYVSPTGWAMWTGEAEFFRVMLDDVVEAEVTVPYYQHDVTNLVEGQEYTTTVVAEYEEAEGEVATYTWTYAGASSYEALIPTATVEGSTVTVTWESQPTPPEPSGDSFMFNFDDTTLEGWTTIDADGDGNNWLNSSISGAEMGYGGSGYGVISQSWASSPLTPDNYLVTAQKYEIKEGSKLSFYACAQDVLYPGDKYGVAISTTGNTDAADFTTIWEEAIPAKNLGNAKSTRGMNAQGNWYLRTVDLSEYAGQEAYIALRHFDCSDVFIIMVDNVSLTVGGSQSGENSFMFDFEDGTIAGWTVIDADGDGHNWKNSILADEYVPAPGYNSVYCALSESYNNIIGGALTPDNYLVTEQKYAIEEGSILSFYACANIEGWADHYGVAISTTGNTDAADFTMVFEEDVPGNKKAETSREMKDQGAWYQRTVDLSEYAGQEVYIAFRHFNCTDKYAINIDDISLTAGKNADRGNSFANVTSNNTARGNRVVVLSEGFEGSAPATGWVYKSNNTENEVIHTGNFSHTGEFSLRFSSWIQSPDDNQYAITPELSLENEATVSFYYASGEYDESFRVGYSTTGNNETTDFTWGETNEVWTSNNFRLYEMTLPAGTKYVAINYCSYWKEYFYIDDFVITTENGDTPDPDPNPDPETPEVLGVYVYRDGELLTESLVTSGSFVDTNVEVGVHTYCIKTVYTDYGMSELACIEVEIEDVIECTPPEDLYGEYVYESEQSYGVNLIWPYSAEGEWLYYDDGTLNQYTGAGGPFYWGVMFPASSISGYNGASLTKVQMYDFTDGEYTSAGDYTLNIYYGGTTAPATLIHTQNFTMAGTNAWHEIELTSALPLDVTWNVWVVVYCGGSGYPAAATANTGDPNGRWVSLDGVAWYDGVELGVSCTFMIRAFVTNSVKGGEMVELPSFEGEVGTGKLEAMTLESPVSTNRSLTHYNVYRSTTNSNYELIAEVEAGSKHQYFDDLTGEPGTYYYQVTAVYEQNGEDCESEPANSYLIPENNYVNVEVTNVVENVNSNVAVYPNPTRGDLRIEAEGLSRITMTSVLGQVVMDKAVESSQEVIDVSQMEAGIYMIRIVSESGVTVKRVNVIK